MAPTQAQAANCNFSGSGLTGQTIAARQQALCALIIANTGDPIGMWGAFQLLMASGNGL